MALTPKATKVKGNKRDSFKLKSFCITQDTVNKMKRQATKWETIFADHVSGKGLTSKTDEELHNKTLSNPIKNV